MSSRFLVRICSPNLGRTLRPGFISSTPRVRDLCPNTRGTFFLDSTSSHARRAFSQSLPYHVRASSNPQCAEKTGKVTNTPESADDPPKKEGLVARFKKMYKEYWYVLVPVHLVTSAGWLGGFYYLSKSGVDIATILESWHFNQTIIAHLRDSHLGHLAIAYFLYKIFTPLRYMLTLGGTTLSIKYLSHWGYIRPVPSKDKLMKMYQDKKAARIQAKEEKLKSDQE
ncbi:FAM210A [Sergentomyia squamirostris]